jgi:histidine triad (HIT) family protein
VLHEWVILPQIAKYGKLKWLKQAKTGYTQHMETCIFCDIANGSENTLIWHNDVAAAFHDIHPKAPVHILVVPKRHIRTLDDLDDANLASELIMAVQAVAKQEGISGAYRVHINVGKVVGQIVDHLHFHILGRMNAEQLQGVRAAGL